VNDADSQNSSENTSSSEIDLSEDAKPLNQDCDTTDSTSHVNEEEEKVIKKAEEKALLDKNEENPILFTGGILRQYQKDGYKWLKVKFTMRMKIFSSCQDDLFPRFRRTCLHYETYITY
jgi:SNF2 family DNA or RNA helicase